MLTSKPPAILTSGVDTLRSDSIRLGDSKDKLVPFEARVKDIEDKVALVKALKDRVDSVETSVIKASGTVAGTSATVKAATERLAPYDHYQELWST